LKSCSRSSQSRNGQKNNPATALGRRARLFAGSDRGAERAAIVVTLIMTARLNNIDPQAWLADVFAASRISHKPVSWKRKRARESATGKAA
jgi:hypothetical protein